jgi:hypothetical protein
VLVGFHLEQLEDFINVVELFLLRNVSGLSQQRGEFQRLSNRGSGKMDVLA